MPDSLAKVPFLRLLLPLTGGILVQYFLDIKNWNIIFLSSGLIFIALSFLIQKERTFKYRWVFGIGCFLFLFSIGIITTSIKQYQIAYPFSQKTEAYKGYITELPQNKPKSIACKIKLESSGKKIICYIQKGVRSQQLKVGEEIMLHGNIEPFKNIGNPQDFDYMKYMYIKGFAGTAYLYSDDWEATGKTSSSLYVIAQQCRETILKFYRSLQLNETEYSILSALTVGYTDTLSDDLKQSFRATGTAHIMAISGLHVGIIYIIILSFIGIFRKRFTSKSTFQLIILICLWAYAFVTGLTPSVVRGTLFLTIFCFSNILNRKGLTYNNIAITAFLMLLVNPFSLFDIGFQLSFMAVLSICFFHPLIMKSINVKNKFLKPVWSVLTLSLAAQIGTFPLCLYYFGTFPTYFFITNLLIIPLVSLIIYSDILLFISVLLSQFLPPTWREAIYFLPVYFVKALIKSMVEIIRFFEKLPYAIIENVQISFASTISIILIISTIPLLLITKKPKVLIFSLGLLLSTIFIHIGSTFLFPQNTLSIYNSNNNSIVSGNVSNQKFTYTLSGAYKLFIIGDKRFLSVSENVWEGKIAQRKFEVDCLHIFENNSISLYSLTPIFSAQNIILDSSLSSKSRKKLIKECEKLNIPYYDISEKGSFSINF